MINVNEEPPPAVDEKIVAYLERRFPNRLPSGITTTDREIAAQIGQQQVISHLRFLLTEQRDLALAGRTFTMLETI